VTPSITILPAALAGHTVVPTTDSHGNAALAVFVNVRSVATAIIRAATDKGCTAMPLKPSRREVFEYGASVKVLVTAPAYLGARWREMQGLGLVIL
jgi:hypothetical protein